MAQFQSNYWKFRLPRVVRTPLFLLYLLGLFSLLMALTYYFRVQPQIPMFYTLAQDSNQLVPREWLFFFPAITLGISTIHTIIVLRMQSAHQLLLLLFSWTSVVITGLLVLSMLRIIVLVS